MLQLSFLVSGVNARQRSIVSSMRPETLVFDCK
jgi:hypothetical protein